MRKFAWAMVALFLFVLTACSDDVSSRTQPTSPASPPPSTAGTPDPSPTPDEQTPEEFVRAWVAEYNAMQNTGDTKKFRSMSRRCDGCSRIADQIEAIYSAGGFIETSGWTIRQLKLSKPNKHEQLVATVQVSSAPTTYVEEPGGEDHQLAGGRAVALLSLAPRADTWNVFRADQQAA